MAAFDEGLSAFDGGACDFDVLAGFGGGEAAAGDHVAVAEDGEVEGESDEGCGASGGHGLDGHDGLLGGADELVDGLDLDLHEEAAAIEKAINAVLDGGYRTVDIMSEGMEKVSCSKMGDLVAERI